MGQQGSSKALCEWFVLVLTAFSKTDESCYSLSAGSTEGIGSAWHTEVLRWIKIKMEKVHLDWLVGCMKSIAHVYTWLRACAMWRRGPDQTYAVFEKGSVQGAPVPQTFRKMLKLWFSAATSIPVQFGEASSKIPHVDASCPIQTCRTKPQFWDFWMVFRDLLVFS